MPPCEQVALQPSLALMLAEHRVQHTARRCEPLIIPHYRDFPLPVSILKNRTQFIRHGFIRAEYTEVFMVLIEFYYIAKEESQHSGIRPAHCTRRRNSQRMIAKVRHTK